MSLDKYVVNVTVSLGGPTITRLGLGTPLLIIEGTGAGALITTIGVDDDYGAVAHPEFVGSNAIDILDDMFSQPYHFSQVKVADLAAGAGVGTWLGFATTDLDEFLADDADWYYCIFDDRSDAVITTAYPWFVLTANTPRIALFQTDDAAVTVYQAITTAANDRCIGVYHDNDAEYVTEAWDSFAGSADPENTSTTWAHRTLTGITPNEYTTAVLAVLRTNNTNYYDTLGGVGDMMDGKMLFPADTYIDQRVAADWLAVRVGEDLRQLLLDYGNRNSKIPFTDPGFQIVASACWKRLNQGIRVGHFIEGSVPHGEADEDMPFVDMPSIVPGAANPVLAADETNRLLRFTMGAKLAGAVHRVVVTINLET